MTQVVSALRNLFNCHNALLLYLVRPQMLSMNPSGSVSLSVLTNKTLLSASRPRVSFISLNLCSVQIRASAPRVTAPDSPETILGSVPSGLYRTRMPLLVTESVQDKKNDAVFRRMGQPCTLGTPQHRPAMIDV